ncbi:MAG: SO2930 family diheme c-type cytochrome [Aquirufa sp.]
MKYITFLIFASLILLGLMSTHPAVEFNYKENLSEYGFFKGDIKLQIPSEGVVPYALNAPLFSDYAHKLRFVRLPNGQKVNYNPDSVLQFPVGTAIVKTFYYKNDERKEQSGRRLMETRVLLHEPKGWVALPYIWNKEQTEAVLEVAGGSEKVAWLDQKGEKRQVEYSIPNMNQCKGCHERGGKMTPIGPSARQLNGDFEYTDGRKNQLAHWSDQGYLNDLPKDKIGIPRLVNYSNSSESLDERVKAYLDINCAHCHNSAGPARSSGLFLGWDIQDKTAYGFMKPPVAAGRGSGNLRFDIVPGKPEESILHYRMASKDPGVMMPELGRSLNHEEGIELVREWIKSINNKSTNH